MSQSSNGMQMPSSNGETVRVNRKRRNNRGRERLERKNREEKKTREGISV